MIPTQHKPTVKKVVIVLLLLIGALGSGAVLLRGRHDEWIASPPVAASDDESTSLNSPSEQGSDTTSDTSQVFNGAALRTKRYQTTTPLAATTTRRWLPAGRFYQAVFTDGQLDSQEVVYGSMQGFDGNPEDLYMTITKPAAQHDGEADRPVIVAMTGGDETGAYCGMTYDEDKEAMRAMAQLGYVTVTLRAITDDSFCGFANSPAQYVTNIHLNLQAANRALGYLAQNRQTLLINPDRMALYGYSIGGTTALLKTRSDFETGNPVRAIMALSAYAPADFGPYIDSGLLGSPSILMVSYETDTGFGGGIVPDVGLDCLMLTNHGFPCSYGRVDGAGHGFEHQVANNSVLVDTNGRLATLYDTFTTFMRQNLID